MARYTIKRILWIIPILIGVITIVFFISAVTPGNPAASLLGPSATTEEIQEMEHVLGLDQPLIKRWVDYIIGIFTRFDFGTSYVTRQPVRDEIFAFFPVTLQLAIYSTLLGIAFGIPLGVVSALKQYTWVDSVILVVSVLMISLPNFWLAMMLIKVFAVDLKWLPSYGLDSILGWVLPVVVAGLQSMTQIIRITRSSMLEVMRQDYIRTARAKGQDERIIVTQHMLRNAMIPIVTAIGMQFSFVMTGSVLAETVFAWPGIGRLIVDAINKRDTPTVTGSIILCCVMMALINLATDIVYAFCDPRIKAQYSNKR